VKNTDVWSQHVAAGDTIEIIDEWQLVYVNDNKQSSEVSSILNDAGNNQGFEQFEIKPLSQRRTMDRNRLKVEQGYIGDKDISGDTIGTKTTKNSTCQFELPAEKNEKHESKTQISSKMNRAKFSKHLNFSKAQRANVENVSMQKLYPPDSCIKRPHIKDSWVHSSSQTQHPELSKLASKK